MPDSDGSHPVDLDYDLLERLRQSHPAWRLLCADQAPLIASFLNRVFIVPNTRYLEQSDLVEALEDELFGLNERFGEEKFRKSALEYLNDWAANEKGWLRKFYRQGSDEPCFDLTPSTEKAISWLASLGQRSFVGTESRLLTLFELLKQMTEGAETNAEVRMAELLKRRAEVDAEIERLQQGDMRMLDDTALKERFLQFTNLARELLADFREVEQNFRGLDRRVRERIATAGGSKGALLEEVMGERDAIADSDQGRSFRAFWDFLMSSKRERELSELLEKVLALPAVVALQPESRWRKVHYDWLAAGQHTQKTVAQLSQQLRRFLDDSAWLENKRIMEILHGIEGKALALRDLQPTGDVMSIMSASADIELPMERPLYTPTVKTRISDSEIYEADDGDIDTSALFAQMYVDKDELRRNVRQALQTRSQISLSDLIELYPLQHGLAELVTYLQLASDSFKSVVDEQVRDHVVWSPDENIKKQAHFPRVIFVR